MFPIGDDNPTRRPTVVNKILILLNVLVFLLELVGGDDFIITWSFIPASFSDWLNGEGSAFVLLTIATAMFMHAGIAHIFGNMLFLWIFGDNVEDEFGRVPYLVFYLVCGVGATLAQYLVNPISQIPNLGASGAISGVLGAYLVMHPLARVRLFVWPFSLFVGTIPLPAVLWIGVWFYLQLASGFDQLGMMIDQGGTAFWAHIGGFVVGFVLVWFLRPWGRRAREAYASRWRT